MFEGKKWPKLKTRFFKLKLDYWLLFLFLGGYYGYLQWNNLIGDPDGFYHAKMAVWLRQGILLKSMPWMQYSSITEHFTDHHLLYHLLLTPFTYIINPLIGVKVAAVFFAVAMILVFYWLLKKLGIIWPWLVAFLFISAPNINYRLSMIKVTGLSLLLIWLLIYCLYFNKRYLSFVVGFVFVWLYGGWPLTPVIVALFLLANFIYDLIHKKRIRLFHSKHILTWPSSQHYHFDKKIMIFLGSGLLAGLIINPYFPHNLKFYYEQVFLIGFVNYGSQFSVGAEWYGLSPMELLSASPHFFVLAVLAFVIMFFNFKKISRLSWFALLLTFLFFIMTLKSRRYIEYYQPFLLFLMASLWTDLIKKVGFKKIIKYWERSNKWLKLYILSCAGVFLSILMPNVYSRIIDTRISPICPMYQYQPSAEWMKKNIAAKSVIFHDDWDEWSMLYYFNDQNYYLVGLDFSFMYFFDKDLQKKYIDITMGQEANNLDTTIKNDFRSNYVFVEKKDHEAMIKNLEKNPNIFQVYKDDYFIIYQIL